MRVLVYDVPEKPADAATGRSEVADSSLHTIHNLQLIDLDGDQPRRDRGGVPGRACSCSTATSRATGPRRGSARGNQESKPFKGVERGQGRPAARTARPTSPRSSPGTAFRSWSTRPTASDGRCAGPEGTWLGLWSRQVIAEPLQWGHAVWCADLDGDGDDELIIGQRDPNPAGSQAPRGPGVFVFDPKRQLRDSLTFERHTIDDGRHGLRGRPRRRPRRRRPARHRRRRPGHP